MTLYSFARLVQEMRDAQKAYKRTRSFRAQGLAESKEKDVDMALKLIRQEEAEKILKSQPDLF